MCLSFQLVLCLTASAHTHTHTHTHTHSHKKIHIISATAFSPLGGCCDHHHYPHIKLPSSLLTHSAISIPVLASKHNLDSTRRAGSIWYKICWICSPSLLTSPALALITDYALNFNRQSTKSLLAFYCGGHVGTGRTSYQHADSKGLIDR